jgi:hypothetical protein
MSFNKPRAGQKPARGFVFLWVRLEYQARANIVGLMRALLEYAPRNTDTTRRISGSSENEDVIQNQ